MLDSLTLVHIAPLTWQRPNGVTHSVPSLIAAQNAVPGVQAGLILSSDALGEMPPLGFPVWGYRAILGREGLHGLPEPFCRPDLAIFHSTFVPVHGRIARLLQRHRVPYILCPRGGLTGRALATKWLKKRLGRLWFFDRLVAHAQAIHYLTPGELEASGPWDRPVIVVGNGTWPPPPTCLARPGQQARRHLTFLGRLDIQQKGLDVLLEACALVADRLRAAHATVSLYGSDFRGSTARLASHIAQRDLASVVKLSGAVMGQAKAAALRQADVFLHPSRFEGHPNAVLEALSYGVPCLVSRATNVADEIVAAGAGWEVPLDPQGLGEALVRVVHMDSSELLAYGQRARQWILQQYTWDRIAKKTVDAYRRFAA